MLFKHDEYLFWVPIKKYQASQTTQSMHGGAPRTIPKFTILVLLAFTASPDVIHIGIHNNTDQHGATDQKLPCSHGNISVIYVYTRFGTAKRPWRGRRRRYRCARNFSTRRARALRTQPNAIHADNADGVGSGTVWRRGGSLSPVLALSSSSTPIQSSPVSPGKRRSVPAPCTFTFRVFSK